MDDELINIKNKFNKINWDDDKSIINFIKNLKCDIYAIKLPEEGILTKLDNYMEICVFQSNGWIRKNIYTIDKDENNNEYLIREELYDK